jgi:hypothetical protein
VPLPRKKADRKVKSKFWIYCEGSETERRYLYSYIADHFKNVRLVELIGIPKIKQNTPKSLVNRVIEDKKSDKKLHTDIYWIAYDRESPAKYSDKLHELSLALAKRNNIEIALTTVCIEQWFLLHFEYSTAAYDSCDSLLDQSRLKHHLKKIGIDKYEKSHPNLYDKMKPKLSDAIVNSDKLTRYNNKHYNFNTPIYKMNPYTDFHTLLNAIDDFLELNGIKKAINNIYD